MRHTFGTKVVVNGVELKTVKDAQALQKCTRQLRGEIVKGSSLGTGALLPIPNDLIRSSPSTSRTKTYRTGDRYGVRGTNLIADIAVGGTVAGIQTPVLKIQGLESVADSFVDAGSARGDQDRYGYASDFGFKGISLEIPPGNLPPEVQQLLQIINQAATPINQVVDQVVQLLVQVGGTLQIPGLGSLGLGTKKGKTTGHSAESSAYALKIVVDSPVDGSKTLIELGRATSRISNPVPSGVFRTTDVRARGQRGRPAVLRWRQPDLPALRGHRRQDQEQDHQDGLVPGLASLTDVQYTWSGNQSRAARARRKPAAGQGLRPGQDRPRVDPDRRSGHQRPHLSGGHEEQERQRAGQEQGLHQRRLDLDQRHSHRGPAARRDGGVQRRSPEVRHPFQRQLLRHAERGPPGDPVPGQRGVRPGQRQRPDLLPVRSRTARRLTAVASLALAASAVQAVGASPAHAAGCQAETTNPVTGCDDTTPPDTTLVAVRPALSSAGYVRQSTVNVEFGGVPNDDTDTGQITFECQLYNTATPPAAWQSCTSGQAFSGLADTTSTPYTFRVRAVDAADAAITCPTLLLCAGNEEPDYDPTPATTTIKVDTKVPNTFITRTPRDDIRPDWPVAVTRKLQVGLNTNESGAGFACTVNDKPLTCGEGLVTLKGLKSGPQELTARAVDAAGNTDPTPSVAKFFVPDNIRASRGSGWRKVREGEAFDGDLVRAAKVGATLRIGRQRNVREVRLIAPSGPKLGRIQVRVGKSQWYTVNLAGKATGQKSYVVRDQYAPLQSGAIVIRVLSLPRGGSVQLDALVARK